MATVPGAPGQFRILSYTNVRVDGDVNGGEGDGGSPILQHQIGWGTSPNVPGNGGGFGNLTVGTGSGFVTGLTPGTRYYFWSRWRNAIGFGPWSPRNEVTTRDRPDPPGAPAMLSRTQTTMTLKITPNNDGDSPLTYYRLSWSTTPTTPQDHTDQSGNNSSNVFLVTGFQPGRLYYFWGQTANKYGISDFSPRVAYTLVAGALVRVDGVWKRAVPYVKVSGVWRIAQPWGKISGFWNETPD